MRKKIKGVLNLNYIEVQNVPTEQSEQFGNGVRAEVLKNIEWMAATEILGRKVPIRGMEVKFFRSVLALSQRQLGESLGYSDVAILKWEKAKFRRLDPVNEVAVRAFMAGHFGVKIPGTFEALRGVAESPKKLVIVYKQMEALPKAA